MKFKVGDVANGVETSEQIIEANDYLSVLEQLVKDANLYCRPENKEAEICENMINDFVRENNRLGNWRE